MSAIFLYAVVLLVAGKSKYMYVWVWEVKWGGGKDNRKAD